MNAGRRSRWWLPPMEEHDALMRHTRDLRRCEGDSTALLWLHELFQSQLRLMRDDIPTSHAAIVLR
jgi:hypothetical protein